LEITTAFLAGSRNQEVCGYSFNKISGFDAVAIFPAPVEIKRKTAAIINNLFNNGLFPEQQAL